MAQFFDQTFDELMTGAPKLLRAGLSGTRTYVLPLPGDFDHGVIVETNSQSRILGSWTIAKGAAYRITPQKVQRMPLIQNDPDPIRRFCRLNGLPLTKNTRVEWGEEVYFGPYRHQGDCSFRWIKTGESPIAWKRVLTTQNPEWVEKLLVVKGEEPRTWEEFCIIAREWAVVQDGQLRLEP